MARGSQAGKPGEVGEFTVLKNQPRSDEALVLLKKIHSVKPIMRKHGWYLPVLSEFFPNKTNLLGVNINGGAKICLRLRPHFDASTFLDLEEYPSLVSTMLHELTHNVRGPHDQIFYKQLDKLEEEFNELQRNGYSGEGFMSDGRRVGVGVGHDIDPRKAREMAVKKAEERARLGKLLGGGGRLGGKKVDMTGKKMSDILADAAERRRRDAVACGAGSGSNAGGSSDHTHSTTFADLPPAIQAEVTKAAHDSDSFIVDLTGESDDDEKVGGRKVASSSWNGDRAENGEASSSRPVLHKAAIAIVDSDDSDIEILDYKPASATALSSSSTSSTTKPAVRGYRPIPPSQPSSSKNPPSSSANVPWTCSTCTYLNPSPLTLACEVCTTPRAVNSVHPALEVARKKPRHGHGAWEEEGWTCHECGEVTEFAMWSCRGCGAIKLSSERS